MAIGWTGQWAASIRYEAEGAVRVQAGMELTHLRLHPGEEIRTPKILLAFWRGTDEQRGSQVLRRTLINHYTPRRNGHVVFAPICGTVGVPDPDGTYEGPHIRVMKPLAERGINDRKTIDEPLRVNPLNAGIGDRCISESQVA